MKYTTPSLLVLLTLSATHAMACGKLPGRNAGRGNIKRSLKEDIEDTYGIFNLHDAAKKNNIRIAMLFLDNGALVGGGGSGADTPLHEAVRNGHLEMCWVLLSYGANVDAREHFWFGGTKTPLWDAAKKGFLEICKLLIRNGADVNASDEQGIRTILYDIKRSAKPAIIHLLKENGAKG